METIQVKLINNLKVGDTIILSDFCYEDYDREAKILEVDVIDYSVRVNLTSDNKATSPTLWLWLNEGRVNLDETIKVNNLQHLFQEEQTPVEEELKLVKAQLEELKNEIKYLKEVQFASTTRSEPIDKYAIYKNELFNFQGSVWKNEVNDRCNYCMICQTTGTREFKLITFSLSNGYNAGGLYYFETFKPNENYDAFSDPNQFDMFKDSIKWLEDRNWQYVGQMEQFIKIGE